MKKNSLLDRIKSLNDLTTKTKNDLADLVIQLPENRIIKKKGTNCFTVSSSQLNKGTILSPRSYNFSAQYREIAKRIRLTSFERLPDLIKRLLTDTAYHQTVRHNLKMLWERT